jgi:hypothetical protein
MNLTRIKNCACRFNTQFAVFEPVSWNGGFAASDAVFQTSMDNSKYRNTFWVHDFRIKVENKNTNMYVNYK